MMKKLMVAVLVILMISATAFADGRICVTQNGAGTKMAATGPTRSVRQNLRPLRVQVRIW